MHVWLLHFLTKDSRIFQSDLQTPCGKWCSLDSVIFCIAEQFSFPELALCHVLGFYPSSHHSLSSFLFKAHHVCFYCSVLPWNFSIISLPPRSSQNPHALYSGVSSHRPQSLLPWAFELLSIWIGLRTADPSVIQSSLSRLWSISLRLPLVSPVQFGEGANVTLSSV